MHPVWKSTHTGTRNRLYWDDSSSHWQISTPHQQPYHTYRFPLSFLEFWREQRTPEVCTKYVVQKPQWASSSLLPYAGIHWINWDWKHHWPAAFFTVGSGGILMVWNFFSKDIHSPGVLAYMPAYMFSVTVFSILLFIPNKPQLDEDGKTMY